MNTGGGVQTRNESEWEHMLGHYCAVYNCSNNRKNAPAISFFIFCHPVKGDSMWVRVRVSCRVRFSVRVSFTVRVSVRVIQVAILSCNCEATQQRRCFIANTRNLASSRPQYNYMTAELNVYLYVFTHSSGHTLWCVTTHLYTYF